MESLYQKIIWLGVTFGKIKCTDSYLVIQYVTGMVGESIDVTWTTDLGAARQAFAPVCWYDCNVKSIKLAGFFSMGFQTTGNGSTNNIFATFNTRIGQLTCDRDPTSFTENGHHGFYLLGNYGLQVDKIYSTGYYAESGTASNAFKFRDNWDCDLGQVICDRAQIGSDANLGTPLLSCMNNSIDTINMQFDPLDTSLVGDLTVTSSGSGVLKDNTINWFRGRYGTSGTLSVSGQGGIIFTGYVDFTNSSEDIQASGTVFRGAEVHWDDAETQYYTRDMVAHNTHFVDRVRIQSSLETYNCRMQGGLRQEAGAGTKTLIQQNTVVETDWDTVLSSGTVNATMSNCDIQVDRPSTTIRPNGTNKYKFVAFNNGYYLNTTADTDFVTV